MYKGSERVNQNFNIQKLKRKSNSIITKIIKSPKFNSKFLKNNEINIFVMNYTCLHDLYLILKRIDGFNMIREEKRNK